MKVKTMILLVLMSLLMFGLVGCNLFKSKTDEQLWKETGISLNDKKEVFILSSDQLDAVSKLISRDYEKTKNPKVIDSVVLSAAECLDDDAAWADEDRGRVAYNILQKVDENLVIDSIVRHVIDDNNRLHVLFLAVKLGINGSEEELNDALMNYGDVSMAEDYLNSGSSELDDGGRKWAEENGYSIWAGEGSHRASWGEF